MEEDGEEEAEEEEGEDEASLEDNKNEESFDDEGEKNGGGGGGGGTKEEGKRLLRGEGEALRALDRSSTRAAFMSISCKAEDCDCGEDREVNLRALFVSEGLGFKMLLRGREDEAGGCNGVRLNRIEAGVVTLSGVA